MNNYIKKGIDFVFNQYTKSCLSLESQGLKYPSNNYPGGSQSIQLKNSIINFGLFPGISEYNKTQSEFGRPSFYRSAASGLLYLFADKLLDILPESSKIALKTQAIILSTAAFAQGEGPIHYYNEDGSIEEGQIEHLEKFLEGKDQLRTEREPYVNTDDPNLIVVKNTTYFKDTKGNTYKVYSEENGDLTYYKIQENF